MTFFHFCAYAHDVLGFKIDIFMVQGNAEPAPDYLTVYRFERQNPKTRDAFVFTLDPKDPDWKSLAAKEIGWYKVWEKADHGLIRENRKTLRGAILQRTLYDYCGLNCDARTKRKWHADAKKTIENDWLRGLYQDEWPMMKDVLLRCDTDEKRKALKKILENVPNIIAAMTEVND